MRSMRVARSSALFAGFGIVVIALLLGLASDLAVQQLTPVKVAFLLGGLALLIPPIVLRDSKPYWLFLLVLSMPFDITKWLGANLIDSEAIVAAYGMPASGTISFEIYLTDVVLVVMLLPWLLRLCLRKETLYFPKIGYLFIFYLGWALLVSLLNSVSLYLTAFEFARQFLYFVFFVYMVNNVKTGVQLRSVVCAVFLGLIIGAGSITLFFELGLGTETVAFAALHDNPTTSARSEGGDTGISGWAPQTLTLHSTNRIFGSMLGDREGDTQRSQGIFRHPAIAAGLCGLGLPLVLAYLFAARTNRGRFLFLCLFAWGFIGLLLTFSRAGLIGLMGGTIALVAVAGWSRLVSGRAVAAFAAIGLLATAVSLPLLVVDFDVRSQTFYMRFNMMEAAVLGYAHHPFLGVGLNNGTASMKASREELRDEGVPMPPMESADSYYLAILTEVGPVGSILFFGFFAAIVVVALRSVKEASAELKPLLAGMIGGLASLATQSLADEPLQGHAIGSTLWLFAALTIAIRHYWLAASQPLPMADEHAVKLPRATADSLA